MAALPASRPSPTVVTTEAEGSCVDCCCACDSDYKWYELKGKGTYSDVPFLELQSNANACNKLAKDNEISKIVAWETTNLRVLICFRPVLEVALISWENSLLMTQLYRGLVSLIDSCPLGALQGFLPKFETRTKTKFPFASKLGEIPAGGCVK